ncbi:hypothetical protein DFH06DRAFT_1249740 [Mycena polygramma]|nr:hypothetical protein DFH06DRAFT_1249740 [Mycena polygramma]
MVSGSARGSTSIVSPSVCNRPNAPPIPAPPRPPTLPAMTSPPRAPASSPPAPPAVGFAGASGDISPIPIPGPRPSPALTEAGSADGRTGGANGEGARSSGDNARLALAFAFGLAGEVEVKVGEVGDVGEPDVVGEGELRAGITGEVVGLLLPLALVGELALASIPSIASCACAGSLPASDSASASGISSSAFSFPSSSLFSSLGDWMGVCTGECTGDDDCADDDDCTCVCCESTSIPSIFTLAHGAATSHSRTGELSGELNGDSPPCPIPANESAVRNRRSAFPFAFPLPVAFDPEFPPVELLEGAEEDPTATPISISSSLPGAGLDPRTCRAGVRGVALRRVIGFSFEVVFVEGEEAEEGEEVDAKLPCIPAPIPICRAVRRVTRVGVGVSLLLLFLFVLVRPFPLFPARPFVLPFAFVVLRPFVERDPFALGGERVRVRVPVGLTIASPSRMVVKESACEGGDGALPFPLACRVGVGVEGRWGSAGHLTRSLLRTPVSARSGLLRFFPFPVPIAVPAGSASCPCALADGRRAEAGRNTRCTPMPTVLVLAVEVVPVACTRDVDATGVDADTDTGAKRALLRGLPSAPSGGVFRLVVVRGGIKVLRHAGLY